VSTLSNALPMRVSVAAMVVPVFGTVRSCIDLFEILNRNFRTFDFDVTAGFRHNGDIVVDSKMLSLRHPLLERLLAPFER
jgi:hypothetical protein